MTGTREATSLVAEFCGRLAGVLSLEPDLQGSIGAGSPVRLLPTSYPLPYITVAVA